MTEKSQSGELEQDGLGQASEQRQAVAEDRHDTLDRAVAEPRARTLSVPRELDIEFYRAYYEDLKKLNDEQIVYHWSGQGRVEGRHPRLDAALQSFSDRGNGVPKDFIPEIYRLLNPDVGDPEDPLWKATVHYLRSGRREGRPYRLRDLPSDRADFLSDLYFDGSEYVATPTSKNYSSLAGMLAANGIHSEEFLGIFDASAYLTRHSAKGLRNKTHCVRHFAEFGLAELEPISLTHWFDPDFYRGIVPEVVDLGPARAYLHWINDGIPRGDPPNEHVFLGNLGLLDTSAFPGSFDPDLYLTANPDLQGSCKSRWQALKHLIAFGIIEGRPGCPVPVTSGPLYLAAADRAAQADDLKPARKLYEKVLLDQPNDVRALQHLGDCLFRLNEWYAAACHYERRLRVSRDSIWAHLNLATCYQNLDRWGEAATVLADLRRLRMGDVAVQRRYHEAVAAGFEKLSSQGSWYAEKGYYKLGRDQVAAASALVSKAILQDFGSTRLARSPVRTVGIVADMFLPQCVFYRVEQKREQLLSVGVSVKVFDQAKELASFLDSLPDLDAVIFYRVPAVPSVGYAIEATRRAGIPSFYDIDDLLFDSRHFPDSFASYGGQIPHDVYAGLVTGTELFSAAMRLCDYAIASTTPLAAAMQAHVLGARAFVHRNAFSKAHERLLAAPRIHSDAGPVHIFYGTGTKAHNQDFTEIAAPALLRIFEKYGAQVHFVVVGYLTMPKELEAHADKITILDPIWDLDRYWQILLGMDVNIAVLKSAPLADSKSEIKWMEAAAAGVPSVVSATSTYREVVADGVTGLVAATPDEWFIALDALVGSSERRARIGTAAREAVIQRYAVTAMGSSLVSMFESVSKGSIATGRRLRVLIVNVFFPPQAFGGATRIAADNVRHLTSLYPDDLEIEIFTTIEGGLQPYQTSVHDWEGVKVVGVTTPVRPDIDRAVVDPAMERAFATHLDRFRPDLVHFHCIQRLTTSICGAAMVRSIPYLITVHDGWWISEHQFLVDQRGGLDLYNFTDPSGEVRKYGWDRLKRMRELQTCLCAARVILSVSEPFADLYRRCGFSNVLTVENGVTEMQVLPRSRPADGKIRIGFFGGISVHKGYYLVRSAFQNSDFANLSLTLIDDRINEGDERTERWGATDVRIRAKVQQHQMGTLYSEIDVLLAPSIWPESYGLVVREAQLAGCWVVASDRGAVGSDIAPGNGFVIDVSTPDGLRQVLGQIDRNPKRYLGPIKSAVRPRPVQEQATEVAAIYFGIAGRFNSSVQRPEVA